MAPPTKGPGVLFRLYSPSSPSDRVHTALQVPGAATQRITVASSTDEKAASGYLTQNVVYEVLHISKLLIEGAYARDPAHSDGTIATLDWQVYKLKYKRSRDGTVDETYPKSSLMVCVGVTPKEDIFEDYEKWFKEEHVEMLSAVPGWRQSACYELAKGFGKTHATPYMAVHFYDKINGLGGPEWLASVETEGTLKIRRNCVAPHVRRVWTVEEQIVTNASYCMLE